MKPENIYDSEGRSVLVPLLRWARTSKNPLRVPVAYLFSAWVFLFISLRASLGFIASALVFISDLAIHLDGSVARAHALDVLIPFGFDFRGGPEEPPDDLDDDGGGSADFVDVLSIPSEKTV